MVSSTFAIELLKNSLGIYSPSRSETKFASFLKDVCLDLGFEQANIDSVGNVIATKGTGDPVILLCGHMDTVPGMIPVRVDGNYLYGRGASDAKAPLIAMLLGAADFPKQNGTIIFAGVVDEEGNATGIKNLVKDKNLRPDCAIFGEPSGIDNITISYKGRLEIRLLCDVQNSAHASAPWISLNAIEEIYDIWNNLKNAIDNAKNLESKNKADLVSYSITEIDGGSSHNVTPQKCRLTIDIRIPAPLSCNDILDLINNHINEIKKQKNNITIKYQVEDKTEPFQANTSSTLVRSLILSILEKRKKRRLLLKKTGTGDMNILGNVFKIPVVTYGPGDPHSSHTIDERICIDEYLAGIEVYKHALFHIIRLHNNFFK